MTTVSAKELRDLLERIYICKGASRETARTVASHQVSANLVGHDSHGVIRTPDYVSAIDRGDIVPDAPVEIERESATSFVIDGHWGFGFSVTEQAMRLAIAKASSAGIAMGTVRRQSHVGRLGGYATLAANEGMIALIMADSGLGPKSVAPFGGRERRLGTNPICFAAPREDGDPVLLDMATSSVAVGKLRVARNRRESIPVGWIVDRYGNPTSDPNDYFDGGAVLPLGGDQGHKGYGLSFIVEVFCGLLTGLGFGVDPLGRHNDGVFIAVFNVDHLLPLSSFKASVSDFVAYLKETPAAKDGAEVLYPGEVEARFAEHRRVSGIELDETTWNELRRLSREVGISGA